MEECIILLEMSRKPQRCSHHCGQAILKQATKKGILFVTFFPSKHAVPWNTHTSHSYLYQQKLPPCLLLKLGKSTVPVSRSDGCVPLCGLKLTISSCDYSNSSAIFPNDFGRFQPEYLTHSLMTHLSSLSLH